jgi:hypothetical protein
MAVILTVPLTSATTTYIDHYEDFNDQDEGAPENPTDEWYAYTTTGFTTAEVNNTLNDASCIFYIADTNGNGAAVAYANFTVDSEFNDKQITNFSFYLMCPATNLTKKELTVVLTGHSTTDGVDYIIGQAGVTANSSDLYISCGDASSDNVSITADSDTQYLFTWTYDWTTGFVTGTINNLTEDIASVTSNATTTYLNTSDPQGLGQITFQSDDNTSFYIDNIAWSGLQYQSTGIDTSVIADLANSFVVVLLMLVFWIALIKMLGKVKLF